MAVTQRALATHLGLTVGTVSRALNGYPDISEATQARVREAADRLGYRANQNARRLSIGTPETVCYLMPRQTGAHVPPFVAELLAGLSDTLAERNWDLLVAQVGVSEDDVDTLAKLIRSDRIAGVVLSRPLKHDPRIALLMELNCPFVVHGRTAASDAYAWFDVDGHDAFAAAVTHLATLGHRRIAMISAPLENEFAQQRLDGFRHGVRVNALETRADYVQQAEFSDAGGQAASEMLLDLPVPPTAFVCASDEMALGALAAIRARGLVPGRDVSVIGYDGVHFGVHANPPLTTMAQPQAGAGRRLGDMLLSVIDGADPRTQQELQRAHLVRRKTDGPPPKSVAMTDVSVREETT
ncbi:MAG: LacI family DNA-binding transcriptional regulator [Pseudomonadota bacterium]